jgi:fibronectin type 3 domain-containing protein
VIGPQVSSTTPASASSSIGLRVSGNQLTRNGYDFLPRGFNMIGLLAPAWCVTGQGPAAASHFGQAELDAAKDWNANTLRFQVSQRGLADPSIAQTARDAYLQRVIDGVQLARSNGFVVIVSMQDQSNGCGLSHPLPSALTATAWNVLAPALMTDRQVMFELFNEPAVENTAEGWTQWRDGGIGPTTNLGDAPVGHQALIDQLRSLGAKNVLIADGVNYAERLQGMPLLDDGTGQLMYGVHPYYLNNGETWWNQQWGYLTSTVPVIATEWNYHAPDCNTPKATLAQKLMAYLQEHRVGLLAHAFDVPGGTITSDWSWSPTDCATAEGGSGKVTKDYFATQTNGPTPLGSCPGLSVRAVTPTRAEVVWEPAKGPVDSFQLLRDGIGLAATPDLSYSDSSVEPGHSYTYACQALDAAGQTGPLSDEVTVTTPTELDTSSPTAPTHLEAMAAGDGQVDLTWEAATDENGVAGYRVSRDGAVIAETSGLAHSDTGVEGNTTYSYTVAAVDAAGNVGPESVPASATTPAPPDTSPPSAPTGLTAVPASNRVGLSWQPSSDDVGVAGYVLKRNGALLTQTGETSYSDSSVQPGATYDYVVLAVDAAGNSSSPSDSVRVLTPLPPDLTAPSAPTQLTAKLRSPTSSSLSWAASTDNVGVVGYRVSRDGSTIATVSGLSYVDNAMPKNAPHVYTVRALDKAGNVSPAATSVSVIAPNSAASGLTGKYYDTATFTSLKATRVDGTLNFVWGTAAPATGIGADTFSVRWTGKVIPRGNEVYTFYTQSDDAVRLWVNGQQLINSWTNHTSREDKATITLKATQAYTIQVDYRENTGSSTAKLSWSSPSVAKAVIPASQLLAQ